MADLPLALAQIEQWLGAIGAARLVLAALAITLAIWLVGLARRRVASGIHDVASRYRARKLIGLLGYALVGLFLLSLFSDRIGEFGVVLGVAGAGIAFALQEVIVSVAGWLALSFGGYYRPGDRIQLGGIKGDVIDIGILRTTLMELGDWVQGDNYNGRIVRVANSFVFKEPVFNYSGDFTFLWDEFKLPVRMTSDWELAQRLIEGAVEAHTAQFRPDAASQWQHMLGKYLIEPALIDPSVTVKVTDNWYEFTARYVVHFRQRRSTRDAIMRDLILAFDANSPAVQFGSTTIELVAVPPIAISQRNGH